MKRFLTIFVTALLWCLVTTNLWAAAPSTQARSIGFTNITASGAKASWINGNGVGRFVVIAYDTDGSDTPDWDNFETNYGLDLKTLANVTDAGGNYTTADGNNDNIYTAANGVKYVVIDRMTGTTRTSTFTNLPATNKTYYVHIFEYNTDGDGTGSFNLTNNASNNPRSFTTLAGLAAPTWAATPLTIDYNNNTVVIDWNSVSGATGYLVNVSTGTGTNFNANRLSEYTDLDVGTDTQWDLYLPIAGTYYVAIKAYSNSETSSYSTEQTATITSSMPPKFLAGDAPSLQELTGANSGNFTLTLTFDQALYANNNETDALTTADFAVAAPTLASGLTDASAKVVITSVTHSAGDNVVTLNIRFNDRVASTEGFRIGPANATSIYSGIIAPATAGIPMDISLHTSKGGQYSADITCPNASVLNTNDNIAFTTIQGAIDASTTGAGETIQLKDNTSYSDNVTVNKAVTLTDQLGANDAIVTGTWTLGGSSDVDLGAGTITITDLIFHPGPTSIVVGNVYNGNVTITKGTFNLDNSADIGISVQSNRGTGALTTLSIGDALWGSTFVGSVGKAIYFNNDGSGANGITNVYIQENSFPTSGMTAIDFENVDLTSYLPPISLEAGNSNDDGMLITSKYVYSHATLDASDYLYPGIAVLGTTTTLQGGTATEYNTVAAAIAASSDNGTQSVFLGQGTYTENIALNEAVDLVGKGANATTGTVLQGTVTASATAAAYAINNLYFDCPATHGLVVSAVPIGSLTINNNNFQIGANEYGINATVATIDNPLTIQSNTFALNDATALGINLPDNQITSTLAIATNTFSGTAAGKGIYISTTNANGASTGTINITGNTFSANVGDAIVFEDAVNNANSLSGATINIYNGNDFSQSSYGIKINENSTYSGFIGTTLPNSIDLHDGTNGNTNFDAADIYGGAWYDLTGASAVLYPSIQNAENANTSATLNIGAGTYAEDVTFSGGANLTTITGNGATCELATGKTATIEKDYTFSGFLAPTVIVGDDDGNSTEGNIDDAISLVKDNGTIQIAADAVIGGGTVNKTVTITDAGTGGAIDGTLTVTVSGGDITNLDFTGNPAITVNLTNGCSASTVISGNSFALANGGYGILVQTGNANDAGTFPLNIVGNSFTGGNATSNAIRFRNQTTGFATFNAVNVYDGNTFNTPGYNFYKVNENNICIYLPTVDVKNTTDNTYTTTATYGFYYNPAATTLSTSTESLVTDCTAPTAFTTGAVTTTTNVVAGWWNGDNSAVNIDVPIANDASLAYGTVQIIASRDNWTTPQNLGTAQTINSGDVNTTKTYSFNKATFEALTGFTEGDVWRFNAIITDFAGNQTTGTQSSTTLQVDRVDPTATLNTATADNIINIAEKAAGFDVNAQANENNVTLYVVNTTDNTPDYTNIGTVGFASVSAPNANTAVDIAVSAANGNILDGKTYKVYGKDQAGNLSAASGTSFTADLTAPAAPTNVVINGGNPINNANKTTTTLSFQYAEASKYSYTYTTSGGAGTVSATDVNAGGSPVTINNIDLSSLEDGTITVSVTVKDAAGNESTATTDTELKDVVAPTTPTVVINGGNPINASNYTAVSLQITGETGTTYAYVFTPNNGTPVIGNGTLDVSPKTLTNIDLTNILDGTVTATVTLTDAAGNVSTAGTDTELKDIVAPSAFTTGAVTTVTNPVAGYWNADNTQLNVVVPVANDATLEGGTIKLYASTDNFASDNQQLGSTYTILNSNLGSNYTFNIPAATFEALSGFGEGDVWEFRAVITDVAGNSTTGTKSVTSITVDQVAPTATFVSATADNVINIAEKAAGFNVVAQSSEAAQTLYVVDVTTNPTVTYSNIGTVGFATAALTQANTNTNIAVGAADIKIITGSTYKVYTMDAAGNLSGASTGSFTTDLVAPQITSITSTTADGLYGIGANINFTLNLDEAAIFTANGGNISLPMDLDAGTGNATRSTDAASSTSLSLTYTVANGHEAADLTHDTGPAVLNGSATWTDAAGNPVNLALPTPTTFQNAKAIVIDGVPPTFTVAYHLNSVTGPALGVNPTIGIGSNYYIKITASEELNNNPTISIGGLLAGPPTNNVTAGSTFTHIANTVFSYNRVVVETEDNGTDELITITGTDLAGNTATDAVPTNASPTANPANTGNQAKVDGKRPQPVITLATPVDYNDGTNDWTNNNPIAVNINYGETVQNVTNSVVTATNGTKSNFVNNANTTFTLDVTPSPTTQGTEVTVSVPEGNAGNQIKDAGGNYAYSATKSIKYDGTAPTTTDNVPAGWQNADFNITLTPSDGTGSGVASTVYSTDGNAPGTPGTTIAISTEGQYTIKYRSTDNVGNQETIQTAANTAKLDKTAPTIVAGAITAPLANAYLKGGAYNITWDKTKFSDPLSGLNNTSVELSLSTDGGTNWSTIATGLDLNHETYSWTVPSDVNSSQCLIKITIADNATNTSSQNSGQFTIDNTPPTATITITPNNSPINGYSANAATSSWTVKATFNESMKNTVNPTIGINTELDDILGVLTGTGWTTTTLTNDTYTWTATVTDLNLDKLDNTVTVSDAQDLAGNSMASTDLTNVKVDQVTPTVTSLTAGKSVYNKSDNGTTTTFQAVFSEAMETTNIPVLDFNGANLSTVFAYASQAWSVGNTTYTATDNVTDDGATSNYAVKLRYASGATDLAGNAPLPTLDDVTFVVDMVAPVIAFRNAYQSAVFNTNTGDKYAKQGENVFFEFTASELLPTNYLDAACCIAEFSGEGGTNYNQADVSGTQVYYIYKGGSELQNTPEGELTYNVKFVDSAGNCSNTLIGNSGVIFDKTLPVISNIKINAKSDGQVWLNSAATGTITFDLVEQNPTNPTVSLFQSNGTTALNVATATYSGVTGTAPNFTYTYTVTGLTGDFTNCIIKVDETDLAGNVATQQQLSPAFNVDNTAPTLTTVTIASNNAVTPGDGTNAGFAKVGDDVTVAFTASENIQTPTVTIEGQNATESENGANPNWKGVYTMTNAENDGTVDFTINFSDLAGNAGAQVTAVTNGSSITFDKTNPSISITSPNADDCVNGTQALTFTVTEDNPATTTQAKIASGTLTNFTSGSAISTLDGWDDAGQGSQTITVQHTDKAGNVGTATRNVTKDTQAPTIVSITRGNVTLGDNTAKVTTDNSVTFTVTFSEPVDNFNADDVTLNTTGSINSPDIAVTGTGPYTVTVGGNTAITGDGTLGITVNTSNIVDCANNALAAPITSATFTIDNTPPTVTNVVNNCNDSPVSGYLYNQAAQVTFTEGVYTNSNATGALVNADLNVTASGGNATLQSWSIITGSHTAGGTTLNITTNWNGTILGSEQLRADAASAASIYDQAGNAMAVAGSNQGGPNPPKNWDYTKAQIVILTQPVDATTCETGSAQFTTSAQGGLSVAYQWQYYDGSDWVNLTNTTINGATFSGATTSQLTITNPSYSNWNGKQFRCNVTNDCGSLPTNVVTLTVNPNVAIQNEPSSQQACFGSVNATFSVVASGTGPYTYQWEVYNGSNWINATNGTPTNATYANATTANLNVTGNIAVGNYQYRVVVSGGCGAPVTSSAVTLTVNSVPSASLTVEAQNATVCTGTGTNIQVVNSENDISYQLRIGTTPVGSSVTGNGSTINLPTGSLTSNTTFNVLATNANCSVQLTQTATVTVEDTPVNPTLATASPASGSTVCQGSTVLATFNAGSGGSGTDSYQYSLDNGSSWTAYTPGNNLTVGTQTVIIQGRRNASVCNTSWSTLATWNVELTPVAASLTKDPNTLAVCTGTGVRATWPNHGTGGNGTYTYEYRTSTNGGTNWTNWTTYNFTEDGNFYGGEISTTGLTNVEIRATRNAYYCAPATNTVSWTVNPLPTTSISGTTPACQSTVLTATTNASSPSYQWKLNGNNITGATSSSYTATASGNYSVVVTDGVTGCTNESAQYSVTIDAMPTQYNVTGGPYCAGSNIGINLSGSQNGYTYYLKRNGTAIDSKIGDGNALTFNVNAAQAGTYTIEAVNGTCQIAMNGSVTVNSAPTAYAGADAYTCGTTGYTVNDATATNYASVSWSHNGLGSISNGTTLTPIYTPAAGDIGNTVTLTLTVNALNGCVNTNDAMALQVIQPATANAGNDASICEAGTFTVSTATASNYTSLLWSHNGTGSISNGTTLTPTYTPGVGETGAVTLTLTANGTNGCNATDNMILTINPNPSITTNATNQTRCGTGNVTFTAATTSSNSVIDWSSTNDFASYTSGNTHTVSVTAGNTDTYYYRARNTETGCVSGTQTVTGTAYVVPTPTITGNSTVGLNTNLQLTTQTGKSGYTWSVDGGTITSGDNTYQIQVQWASAGTKNVTVTYSENGCPGISANFQVTVSEEAAPVITGNPSNTTKCSNDANATFSVTSVSGVPAPTLQWQVSVDGGSNWTAASGVDYNGANTTELTVYNLSGKNGYQYRLFATNGVNPDDYSDAATLTVTTAQTPSVTITSSDEDNTFCSGTNVTFTATPSNTGGGTVSYQWKLNGGNVGANQNTYSNNALVNNDQVQCVITITGGCVTTTTANSNTITNTVLVNTSISQDPADATVNEGDDHTFTVTASGDNLTYTWYKVGTPDVQVGTGSSLELTDIEASDAGVYYVIVSGTCGNVQSDNATLTVQQPAVKLAIDNIGTQTDGTQFTITVRSLNSSNVATNVTQNTGFEITVETGTGTIGTVTGTINNGSSSTTVNVTYNKTGGETGVSLKATRTSGMNLTAGTSNTFTVRAAEPTTQASNIQYSAIGSNYIKLIWTNGTGSKRIVLCEQGNASGLTEVPTDGASYTANTTYASGTQIGGAYVVADTDQDTVSIFGLTYNVTYAFKVIEYNGSGSTANYKTNGFVSGTSNPKQRKIDGKESINESTTIVLGEHFILTGITPNPATSDVNFTVVTKEALDANIEIVNELGVVVHSFSKSLTVGEHPFSLKIGTEKGGLPSGTYLLRVTAGGESLIQKFIYMP